MAQGTSPGQQPGSAPGQSGQQPGQQPGSQGGGQTPGPGQGEASGQSPGGNQPGGERSLAQGGGSSGGNPNGRGGGGGDDDLSRALNDLFGTGNPNRGEGNAEGPITGEDFTSWEERLRTVEALLDSPEARARLAAARERAEQMRAEYRRHATPPKWGDVETGVAAPLSEVRTWLRQELARREDPTVLQPVDRDPVPERFEENVRKYYEALGE
jgi:hypothetical protein